MRRVTWLDTEGHHQIVYHNVAEGHQGDDKSDYGEKELAKIGPRIDSLIVVGLVLQFLELLLC